MDLRCGPNGVALRVADSPGLGNAPQEIAHVLPPTSDFHIYSHLQLVSGKFHGWRLISREAVLSNLPDARRPTLLQHRPLSHIGSTFVHDQRFIDLSCFRVTSAPLHPQNRSTETHDMAHHIPGLSPPAYFLTTQVHDVPTPLSLLQCLINDMTHADKH
ncbi:hypothetical protein VUR80DRAFT_560 [Thermomyces stellatus]